MRIFYMLFILLYVRQRRVSSLPYSLDTVRLQLSSSCAQKSNLLYILYSCLYQYPDVLCGNRWNWLFCPSWILLNTLFYMLLLNLWRIYSVKISIHIWMIQSDDQLTTMKIKTHLTFQWKIQRYTDKRKVEGVLYVVTVRGFSFSTGGWWFD